MIFSFRIVWDYNELMKVSRNSTLSAKQNFSLKCVSWRKGVQFSTFWHWKKIFLFIQKKSLFRGGNNIVFISDSKIHSSTDKSGERILSKTKEWTNKNSFSFLEMNHKKKHQILFILLNERLFEKVKLFYDKLSVAIKRNVSFRERNEMFLCKTNEQKMCG